jgi:hypothetical protein
MIRDFIYMDNCCIKCKILFLTNMMLFLMQTRQPSQYYKETNVTVNRIHLMHTGPLI